MGTTSGWARDETHSLCHPINSLATSRSDDNVKVLRLQLAYFRDLLQDTLEHSCIIHHELCFWFRIVLTVAVRPWAPFADSAHRTSLSDVPPMMWMSVTKIASGIIDATNFVMFVDRLLVLLIVPVNIHVTVTWQ